MSKAKAHELAIIGGGASGLIAAIAAADAGCDSIALYERNAACGAKILVSGGGRCNLTNRQATEKHYFGGSQKVIRNILAAFPVESTILFFESIGVRTVTEEEGRVFPKTHRSRDVVSALVSRVHALGVHVFTDCQITRVTRTPDGFVLEGNRGQSTAQRLLLTCGGSSYPQLGTDGSGFQLAQSLGHSITQPIPALAPIRLSEPQLSRLAGLTLAAALSLHRSGKCIAQDTGSILITHHGISGPATFNISSQLSRNPDAHLSINFIPACTTATFDSWLSAELKRHPRAQVESILKHRIPERLGEVLARLASFPASMRASDCSKHERLRLVKMLTAFQPRNVRVEGFDEAHVTAGGVPLTEIRYQTLESRVTPGLFFAGEVLDVDGITGGYNLQWAWSTGFIAGRTAGQP